MNTLVSDAYRRIVSSFSIILSAFLVVGLLASSCTKTDSTAPVVSVLTSEVNVFGGLKVCANSGKLYLGETAVASWTDNSSPADKCQVSLKVGSTAVSLGNTLKDAGELNVTVTDEDGNLSPSVAVTLTSVPLSGLEALKNTTHVINDEINLTAGLTAYNGYRISKVEIQDRSGVKSEISDPTHYVADEWGGMVLIYTLSKDGCEDVEVTVEGFIVNHLKWNDFQIEEADNVVHGYNFYGNEATSYYDPDIEVSNNVGLFDLESLILEAIANGTTTLKASEVKNRLARNRILWLHESPNPGMDEYLLFERIVHLFDDNPGNHSYVVSKLFLLGTKDVISKLGTKVLYAEDGLNVASKELISYVKNHPELIFFTVNTCTWIWNFESGTYEDLQNTISDPLNNGMVNGYKTFFGTLDNIYFACSSMGNTHDNLNLNTVLTSEEIKKGMHGYYGIEWESGADGIMGSKNYQSIAIANGKTSVDLFGGNEFSLYPTKENLSKENVWIEHTYARPQTWTQATSYAAPAACAKSYLMTCAQLLVNPDLTKAQARKFVRETALDGTVILNDLDENGNLTKEFYGNAKVMNPAGAFPLFYSTFPSAIQVSSKELVPITHGLHKNSVVVGPGMVDKDGNEVTAENYTQMLGKDLYIDPSKVYAYGYSDGDICEYVEYLCVDSKGSGALDRESEAYRSIVSHTVKVTVY